MRGWPVNADKAISQRGDSHAKASSMEARRQLENKKLEINGLYRHGGKQRE
jgi:hypothetical protein